MRLNFVILYVLYFFISEVYSEMVLHFFDTPTQTHNIGSRKIHILRQHAAKEIDVIDD